MTIDEDVFKEVYGKPVPRPPQGPPPSEALQFAASVKHNRSRTAFASPTAEEWVRELRAPKRKPVVGVVAGEERDRRPASSSSDEEEGEGEDGGGTPTKSSASATAAAAGASLPPLSVRSRPAGHLRSSTVAISSADASKLRQYALAPPPSSSKSHSRRESRAQSGGLDGASMSSQQLPPPHAMPRAMPRAMLVVSDLIGESSSSSAAAVASGEDNKDFSSDFELGGWRERDRASSMPSRAAASGSAAAAGVSPQPPRPLPLPLPLPLPSPLVPPDSRPEALRKRTGRPVSSTLE